MGLYAVFIQEVNVVGLYYTAQYIAYRGHNKNTLKKQQDNSIPEDL